MALTLSVADTTGVIASGALSSDAQPEITVSFNPATVSVGEFINIFNNGLVIGAHKLTAADLSKGSITLQPPALTEGTYSLTSTLSATPALHSQTPATYPAALQSTSAPFVDNIITSTPTISNVVVGSADTVDATQLAAGVTVTGNVAGNGAALAGQSVTVDILYKGSDLIDEVTAKLVSDGHGGFTFQAQFQGGEPLPPDSYTVQVSLTDNVGHSTSNTTAFTTIICFMPGTLIATPRGDVAVERLSIGDEVLTSDGRLEPVRWIGRNTVSLVFADPLRALPIRVMAGALGENVPSRDLLVSPEHALLVDGVLVQAGALVNGASILRETNVPQTFTYYHVELNDHSLILAENTPAETFIDNVERMSFDNWDEHQALYGAVRPMAEMAYPRAKAHRQVPAATRQRLAERAAQLGGEKLVSAA